MRRQSHDCSNDARFAFTRGDADNIASLFLVTQSSHGAAELLVIGLEAAGEQIFVDLPLVSSVLPMFVVRDIDLHLLKLVIKVFLILQILHHCHLLGFISELLDGRFECC